MLFSGFRQIGYYGITTLAKSITMAFELARLFLSCDSIQIQGVANIKKIEFLKKASKKELYKLSKYFRRNRIIFYYILGDTVLKLKYLLFLRRCVMLEENQITNFSYIFNFMVNFKKVENQIISKVFLGILKKKYFINL